MPRNRSRHELHCFCRHNPLLAVYGVNEHGKIYVHVRVYKANRMYAELYVEGGTVKLHCRDCFRWHKVIIRQPGEAILQEDQSPPEIASTIPA